MSIGWSTFAPLIVGLLIGWAIEWIIDWLWWRQRGVSRAEFDTLQAQFVTMQSERDTAQAGAKRQADELAELRVRFAAIQAMNEQHKLDLSAATSLAQGHQVELRSVHEDRGRLEAELAKAKSDLSLTQVALDQHLAEIATVRAAGAGVQQRDPLIDINGIGPVYQNRLYAAGIYTFAQLSEADPIRIREIIELKDWQDVDLEAWFAEARAFAEQMRQGTYRKGQS